VKARGDDERELLSLAARIPFDDRQNQNAPVVCPWEYDIKRLARVEKNVERTVVMRREAIKQTLRLY
jgi:hypothetical protein